MLFSNIFKMGSGQCFLSDQALEEVGPELKYYGKRIYILAGENAFKETNNRILGSIDEVEMDYKYRTFKGECSQSNIQEHKDAAEEYKADVILAIGGGKCIDAGKAVAGKLQLPVATVPTIAATCAPYVPGSVVYTNEGKPDGGVSNKYENVCIFLDTKVLGRAPIRYLAAGMADAQAKYHELFLAGTEEWKKFRTGYSYDSSVISAFDLAKTTKKIIEERSLQALKENSKLECGLDYQNMIFAIIAVTGVISGLSGGTGQLQIAHGFHNSLKKIYPQKMHQYLHGELVGTGIIVQMSYNGNTDHEIDKQRRWLQRLSIPTQIHEYGINISKSQYDFIIEDLCNMLPKNNYLENKKRVQQALKEVLKNESVLSSIKNNSIS